MNGLSLGTSFPLLSNARIRPADGQGHIVSPSFNIEDDELDVTES